MQRAVLLWVLIAATAAGAQSVASDAPTAPLPARPAAGTSPISEGTSQVPTATAVGEQVKNEKLHFAGLDLGVTLAENSGIYFRKESYYNVVSLQLDPSFALGKKLAGAESWWAELVLSARLPIEFEISSSEPGFRGSSFTRQQIFQAPETVPLAEAGASSIEGADHRPVRVNDLQLQLAHGKLFKIPGVGLDVGASLRTIAATSIGSRNLGLITAPSFGLALGRSLGPLELSYEGRFTKYFYTRTAPPIVGTNNTVEVSGGVFPTWRPDSSGVTNPDYGFVHGLNLALHLPKGFGLSASYFLFHNKPMPTQTCAVDGVPQADTCADGALVGPVVKGAWRQEQAFSASVDYDAGPLSMSLGLATLHPLFGPGYNAFAQPFVYASAYNYTTVSLSFISSPETIARFLDKE